MWYVLQNSREIRKNPMTPQPTPPFVADVFLKFLVWQNTTHQRWGSSKPRGGGQTAATDDAFKVGINTMVVNGVAHEAPINGFSWGEILPYL